MTAQQDKTRTLTPLHNAAQEGRLDLLQQSIAEGTSVNTMNEQGLTALMLAAAHHQSSTAKELIRLGADLESCTPVGCTALSFAIMAGHLDIVEILVEAGANLQHHDVDGISYCMYARTNVQPAILRLLQTQAAQAV